MFKVAV